MRWFSTSTGWRFSGAAADYAERPEQLQKPIRRAAVAHPRGWSESGRPCRAAPAAGRWLGPWRARPRWPRRPRPWRWPASASGWLGPWRGWWMGSSRADGGRLHPAVWLGWEGWDHFWEREGPTRMGEGSYHWTGCDIWRCLGLFWSLRPYNTLVEDTVFAGNKLKDFWLCIGFWVMILQSVFCICAQECDGSLMCSTNGTGDRARPQAILLNLWPSAPLSASKICWEWQRSSTYSGCVWVIFFAQSCQNGLSENAQQTRISDGKKTMVSGG